MDQGMLRCKSVQVLLLMLRIVLEWRYYGSGG